VRCACNFAASGSDERLPPCAPANRGKLAPAAKIISMHVPEIILSRSRMPPMVTQRVIATTGNLEIRAVC
jgi:hypothetical protein